VSLWTALAGLVKPGPASLLALELDAAGPLSARFATGDTGGTTTAPARSTIRAQYVARDVALSIPAVRKARASLLTIATFRLAAWDAAGYRLGDATPGTAFLRQFEPRRTMFRSLATLLDDAIWFDRSVWKIERDIAGRAAYLERIHPSRIQDVRDPRDPDTVAYWYIDGQHYSDAALNDTHVVFDWAGMGGLRRLGMPLLNLYGDLQVAAGRYARAPHPYGILHNSGAGLSDDEIDELLDEWEVARESRGVAYTEGDLAYQAQGFSARDLQLTEAREHAALEVARLFALPARSVDAKSGDPLTYSTVVENRRDFLEALRPWMAPITQGLSMDVRGNNVRGLLLPRGVRAEFDADAYLRDDASGRMATWQAGLDMGLWDVEQVAAMEPLASATRKA
jgi:hypothetical protein